MTSPSTTSPSPKTTFILRINSGSFATGFSAVLSISEPAQVNPQQRYQLPPCPELPADYQRWQTAYGELANMRKIQPIAAQTTQRSYEERRSDCRKETISFEDKCSDWFHQPTFEALRRSIFSEVRLRQLKQTPILLEVDTSDAEQDILLRKLPWHLWKLLEQDLRSSEVIVSAPVAPSNHQFAAPVNILAVFGSQTGGIQLNGDLAALEQLQLNGANLVLINQPSAKTLQEALWKQHWDVLFFAGHSTSCADTAGGLIYLKDGNELLLRHLRASLNRAVENGLKLAIFNSCDGLALADYLAERRVPVSIVMREPVPDVVARHFLEYFLEEFSQGNLNLQAAVRKARERLQWLESNGQQACPAATWLPIICQNPNQLPLRWPTEILTPVPSISTGGVTIPQPLPVTTPTQPSPNPSEPSQKTSKATTKQPLPSVSQSATQQPATLSTQPKPIPSRPLAKPAIPSLFSADTPKWKKICRTGGLLLLFLLVAGIVIKAMGGPDSPGETTTDSGSKSIDIERNEPIESITYNTIQERMSEGDRELIIQESQYLICPGDEQDFEQLKTDGIDATREQDYEIAAEKFTQALEECRSPEAMIYKNNVTIGTADAYTLAISVPDTDNAVIMLRGPATAQEQINTSGGINGKPLKILIVKDSDDPDVAAEVAQELIDNRPDVIGALGHWSSGVTDKAIRVYKRNKKLAFIIPVSTRTDLVSSENKWVFRATADNYKLQSAIVEHLVNPTNSNQVKVDKVAAFYVDSTEAQSLYSRDLVRQFETLFSQAEELGPAGGQVVEKFNLADSDFETDPDGTARKLIEKAKAQGAQAVLLAPNRDLVGNATAVIKAANEAGLIVLGEVNLVQVPVLKETCSKRNNMIIPLPWHAEGKSNPEFVTYTTALWKGPVGPVTAMTYNATQAMVEAIRLSPGEPTRASVRDALASDNFEVPVTADAEPFTFEENTRAAAAQLVQVQVESKRGPDNQEVCKFRPIE